MIAINHQALSAIEKLHEAQQTRKWWLAGGTELTGPGWQATCSGVQPLGRCICCSVLLSLALCDLFTALEWKIDTWAGFQK